ncbi:hypothetical protein D9M73_290560 [compost metagenome]
MQYQPGPTQFAFANLQPEPMQVDDCRHDRQPQPEAGMAVAFIAAIEPFQYGRPLFFGNTWPAILDRHVHAVVIQRGAYAHPTTLGRKLDRVAHQIRQRLEQQLAIAVQCR